MTALDYKYLIFFFHSTLVTNDFIYFLDFITFQLLIAYWIFLIQQFPTFKKIS